jgi:hypothetical protein
MGEGELALPRGREPSSSSSFAFKLLRIMRYLSQDNWPLAPPLKQDFVGNYTPNSTALESKIGISYPDLLSPSMHLE